MSDRPIPSAGKAGSHAPFLQTPSQQDMSHTSLMLLRNLDDDWIFKFVLLDPD